MGSNNRQKAKTGRTFVQCRTFSCRDHPLTRSALKRAVLRQYPAVLNRRRQPPCPDGVQDGHETVQPAAPRLAEAGRRNGRRGRSEDRQHDQECKGHGRASRDEREGEVRAEPRDPHHRLVLSCGRCSPARLHASSEVNAAHVSQTCAECNNDLTPPRVRRRRHSHAWPHAMRT